MSQENDVDEPNKFRGIEKGEFVALGLDEFKDELPQIARVLMTRKISSQLSGGLELTVELGYLEL